MHIVSVYGPLLPAGDSLCLDPASSMETNPRPGSQAPTHRLQEVVSCCATISPDIAAKEGAALTLTTRKVELT